MEHGEETPTPIIPDKDDPSNGGGNGTPPGGIPFGQYYMIFASIGLV